MASSPLDQFEVHTLLSVSAPIINFGVYFTNLALYLMIGSSVLGTIFIYTEGHVRNGSGSILLVPTRWSVALESLYTSLQGMVSDQIGDTQQIYLPFILSLFTFILTMNLIGNIPYSFSVFTSIILAMSMSITVFLAVTIIGIVTHRVHWFSFFVPGGTPLALVPLLVLIETISYLARAVSLGTRLAANLISGKILAHILAGGLYAFIKKGIFVAILTLIPLSIFVALLGLELAVALIQSYVFTILTCSYINESLKLH